MLKYFLLILSAAIIFVSCSETKEESQPEKTENQQNADPHAGVMPGHGDLDALTDNKSANPEEFKDPQVKISGIELTTPDTWQREAPSSSMRILQFALKSDNALKVTGFFFGEQDLLKENIDRWKAEFAKISSDKEEKLNNDITFIVLEGTYNLKPFPMAQETTPTDGYMVLAAIVPTPEGPYYFKVYGPKNKLNSEISNFKKFLSSYKKIA